MGRGFTIKNLKAMEQSYKQILTLNIPVKILNDPQLNSKDKIILAEIVRLIEYGECVVSNRYLAGIVNRSLLTVSRTVSKLRKEGYIDSCYFDGIERHVRINFERVF